MVKDLFQLLFVLVLVFLLTKPVGRYISKVMHHGSETFLDPIFRPMELRIYKFLKVSPKNEQTWVEYLKSLLIFSSFCIGATFFILMCQEHLPLNTQSMGPLSWDLALNTAISFVTNTNWQSYAGEATMTYLSQMWPLTLQNFLSAAIGLCVAGCFVRGLSRSSVSTLGNFWIDLTRITLYLLIPLAICFAVCFVALGVPQNFQSYIQAQTLEGQSQVIVQGPIASQEAIKLLGTNGGGFTNVNSAHPYENPTPLSNLLQLVAMLLIPSAQIYYFGQEIKNKKHGWTLIASMAVIFILGFVTVNRFESIGNPSYAAAGLDSLSNLEGKETRFGIAGSSLFATVTTATSTGAVNCSHDSLTPLGGLIPFINMQLEEVIFGGVGSGLYGSIVFVVIAIFIAGLVIGKTPEYLGKKIDAFDVKASIFTMIPFIVSILGFTALSSITSWGQDATSIQSAHGFSEMLYAFTSTAANNGSAFSGLNANTPIWNVLLGISMILGRFGVIIPAMALAGSLASKKKVHAGLGSFPVDGVTFAVLFIGTILLVGVLTFLPSLVMGPFIEQFFMKASKLF
jgi:potassium-transporting ATPase potassium-binding subunit